MEKKNNLLRIIFMRNLLLIFCLIFSFANSLLILPKLNQFNDIKLDNLPVSYNSRYTIEFWTMITNIQNFNSGLHIIYKNLVSISLSNDINSTLNVFCWPQDSRLDLSTKSTSLQINAITTQNNLNFYSTSTPNYTSTWIWIRCAVNLTESKFYLSNLPEKILKGDLINLNFYSDFTFRYFWGEKEKTYLNILNAKLNKISDVYIRNLYFFNEYIPQEFKFSNIDLNKLNLTQFPQLIFSINFANYDRVLNKIKYTVENNSENIYEFSKLINLTFDNLNNIPVLCNPGMKYNNNSCETITNCDSSSNLCVNENSVLICKPNFNYDITNSYQKCIESCPSGYITPPNSSKISSFCNLPCDINSNSQCYKGYTKTQLQDLNNNYKCIQNYTRFGYKCYDENYIKNSYIYLNGCLNFQSFYFTFTNSNLILNQNIYNIEFWIKIDKIGENICNTFPNKKSLKKVYFIGDPHIIYQENNNSNLTYEMYNTKGLIKTNLTNFNFFQWNHILINVDKLNRIVKVFVNFNNFLPSYTSVKVPQDFDLNFNKFGFCNNPKTCYSPLNENTIMNQIYWGAAYYKNLRIWNGNSNQWLIQEYNQKNYENLSQLIVEFPLNIKMIVDNKIKSTLGNYSIEINDYNNVDKDTKFNYSNNSLIEYISNPPSFIKTFDSKIMTTQTCHKLCKKCVNINVCLECISGYKLFSNFCKKVTGSFLKLPINNNNLNFLKLNVNKNIQLKNEKIFTITIWIKMFGQIEINQFKKSQCFVIFKFNENGDKKLCYSPINGILYFYYNNQIIFQDANFVNFFGQWCLISITNLMSKDEIKNYFKPISRLYVHTNESEVLNNSLGLNLESFDIGFEYSALISDFRLYRDFIINPYGYIMSVYKSLNLIYFIEFKKINLNCIKNIDISDNIFNDDLIECVEDFHPYLSNQYTCGANSVLDINLFNQNNLINPMISAPCVKCNQSCQLCVGSTIDKCTCRYSTQDSIIKTNPNLQCEIMPFLELSKFNSTVIENIKISRTKEYSIEFYFFIYNYNNDLTLLNLLFDSHELIWEFHNLIQIYSSNNDIKIKCKPIITENNFYLEDIIKDANGKWNKVTCATQLERNVTYLNELNEIGIIYENFPKIEENLKNITTRFIIQPSNNSKTNFGLLFIKDIKLHSFYDIRKINSNCKINSNYYSDLLHFFQNDYNLNLIKDSINVNINVKMNVREDFIGYNIISNSTNIIFPTIPNCNDGITIIPLTTGYNQITPFIFKSNLISGEFLYKFYYIVRFKNYYHTIIQDFNPNSEVTFTFNLDSSKVTDSNTNQIRINLFLEIKNQNGIFINKYFKEFKIYFNIPTSTTIPNLSDLLMVKDITPIMNEKFLFNRIQVLNFLKSDKGNFNWELEPFLNKFQYNYKGESFILPNFRNCYSSLSSTNFCNSRGFCTTAENVDLCICTKLYAGDKCQLISTTFSIWLNLHLLTFNSVYYKIVSFNQILNLNDDLLQSLFILIDSSKKVSTRIEIDLNSHIEILDKIFENNSHTFFPKYSKQYIQLLCDFYIITIRKINKEKYDNLVDKIMSDTSVNNFTFYKTPTRLLQSSTPIDNSKILLKVDDKNLFFLKKDYSNYFVKFDKYLDKIIKQILINLKENNEDTFLDTNSTFDIIIKKLNDNMENVLKYDFTSNLFFNRKIQMKSYVDFSDCLNESFNSNLNKNFTLFIVYISHNIFPFQFDDNLNKNFISLTHTLELYDENLEKIILNCPNSGIIHYQNLYSINLEFLNDFNILPWKYLNKNYIDPNLIEKGKYKVPFIFPNGTIVNSSIDKQIKKYYPQFSIKMTKYDKNNFTLNFDSNLIFEEISNSGFIKGKSNDTGKYFSFMIENKPIIYDSLNFPLGIYKPLDTLFDSYYRMISLQFQNYYQNKCFLFLCFLISLNLLSLFYCLYLYLKSIYFRNLDFYYNKINKNNKSSVFNFARFMNEIKYFIMLEKNLIEKDNLIYKENRFVGIYNINNRLNDLEELKEIKMIGSINSVEIVENKIKNSSNEDLKVNLNESGKSVNSKLIKSNSNNQINILVKKKLSKNEFNERIPISVRNDISNKKNVKKFHKLTLIDEEEKIKEIEIHNEDLPLKSEENLHSNLHSNFDSKLSDENLHQNYKTNSSTNHDNSFELNYTWNITHKIEFEEQGYLYNLFHFIFKRNIYSLNLHIFSYFSPNYKNLSKLFLLIYLELLSILILITMSRTDLLNTPKFDTIGRLLLIAQIIASVTFSNFFVIIISIFYKFDKTYRNEFINKIDKSHIKKEMNPLDQIKWMNEINKFKRENIIKTIFINLLNICIICVLVFVTVTFTSAFHLWQDSIILIWIFTLIMDFILMEILLEIFIWLFWNCREHYLCFSQIFLNIKNLRNFV